MPVSIDCHVSVVSTGESLYVVKCCSEACLFCVLIVLVSRNFILLGSLNF